MSNHLTVFSDFNDDRNERPRRYLLCVIFIILVAIMEWFGWWQTVRRFTSQILQPVAIFANTTTHDISLPYFVIHRSLQNYMYVQDLELRYAEAVAQLGELNRLKKENQDLHQLVDQHASLAHKPVIAAILAYSQPYIGAGESNGIHVGDLVMIGQTFIGRVEEATANQSVITLLTATNALPVLVRTESGVTGVAMGDGTHLLMKEIPQDANLQTGELVVTVGQPEVPAGLSVGRIGSLSRAVVNSAQVAIIDQIVSFYESQMVQVQTK
jgi:cell shape-determining protein MreC